MKFIYLFYFKRSLKQNKTEGCKKDLVKKTIPVIQKVTFIHPILNFIVICANKFFIYYYHKLILMLILICVQPLENNM